MRQRLPVVALAVLAFIFLIPIVYSKARALFSNMQATVTCPASELVLVHSTAEVQAVVRRAKAAGLAVKAASQGWSGSNESSCVATGGIQIDTAA